MPDTLILTRPEIAALVEPRAMLAELRAAFVAAALERPLPGLRVPAALPRPAPESASAMVLLPGAVAGLPAYTVKVHAKVPGGAPAIQGVIVLHDLATGHPLAILESTLLTALRTGLAGALGADALARPDASRVAIIGAGAQGVLQLEALALVRRIEHVWAFTESPGEPRPSRRARARGWGSPLRRQSRWRRRCATPTWWSPPPGRVSRSCSGAW
jgi:ornithine cyclodeaminase